MTPEAMAIRNAACAMMNDETCFVASPGACKCDFAAKDALAALSAAGYAIVPKEPTEEMLRDGAQQIREFMDVRGPYPRTHAMYRAMISAVTKE